MGTAVTFIHCSFIPSLTPRLPRTHNVHTWRVVSSPDPSPEQARDYVEAGDFSRDNDVIEIGLNK